MITELVTATLVARDRIDHCDGGNSDSIGGGGGVLRSVVLQADIELVLREADFVKLAQGNKGAGNDNGNGGDEVEVSLEKVMVSEEGFVVYDSD